jgi:hypothetical protein
MGRRLGISGHLVRRLILDGKVAFSKLRGSSNRSERIVIDTKGAEILQPSNGVVHSRRSAALLTGIPGPVLSALALTGDLEIKHSVTPLSTGFHEADIREFVTKFFALVPNRKVRVRRPSASVLLGKLMSSRFATSRSKAKIIRAVLGRRIEVLGSTDGSLRGIQISSEQCEKYTHFWTPQEKDSKSRSETASLLECNVNVIHSLIKLGLLDGHYKGAALRIAPASIEDFQRRFTFLNALRKGMGVSSQKLVLRCKGLGIKVLYVDPVGGGAKQPFISNHDLNRIGAVA